MPSTCFKTARAAALLGAATGMRSQMGMSTFLLTSPAKALPGLLAKPVAKKGWLVAAGAELVLDKLPNTPPRTKPAGLLPRVGLGGLAGGLAASQLKGSIVMGAAIGAATATAASFLFMKARLAAATKVPGLVAALAEDALAAAAGFAGARQTYA